MKFTNEEMNVINAGVANIEESIKYYKAHHTGRELKIRPYKNNGYVITGYRFLAGPVNTTTNYKIEYYNAMKTIFIPQISNIKDMATLVKRGASVDAVSKVSKKNEIVRYNVGDTLKFVGGKHYYEVVKSTPKTMKLCRIEARPDFATVDNSYEAKVICWDRTPGYSISYRLDANNNWYSSRCATKFEKAERPNWVDVKDAFQCLPKVGDLFRTWACGKFEPIEKHRTYEVTSVNYNHISVKEVILEQDKENILHDESGFYSKLNYSRIYPSGNYGSEENWDLRYCELSVRSGGNEYLTIMNDNYHVFETFNMKTEYASLTK